MTKKLSPSGTKRNESRRKQSTFRPLPSKAWLHGGLSILKNLNFSEWLILAGRVFLPVLDKISKIVSIGVAIKIVVYGVKTTPDDQTRFLLGGAIFMAFGIAGMIQVSAEAVREKMETLIGSLVERLYQGPDSSSGEFDAERRKESFQNQKRVGKGLSAAIGFTSSLALIAILIVLVGWFEPMIGFAVLVLGTLLVNGLRLHRQKTQKKRVSNRRVARDNEGGASASREEESADEEQVIVPFSKGARRRSGKRTRRIRIGMISNFSAALVMAASFLLLSRAHALDDGKIAWIIVFCLGMRLLMAEGAVAIRWWLEMLDQKKVLMELVTRSTGKWA
jgi:hypothetical protein